MQLQATRHQGTYPEGLHPVMTASQLQVGQSLCCQVCSKQQVADQQSSRQKSPRPWLGI